MIEKKKTQDEYNLMYEITERMDNDTNLPSHTSYLARFLHAFMNEKQKIIFHSWLFVSCSVIIAYGHLFKCL